MEDIVLNKVFGCIEEELNTITEDDKTRLDKIKYTNGYDKILDIMESLDIVDTNIKNELLASIELYLEDINSQNSYFNEKFYKQGFKDGISLMIECIK